MAARNGIERSRPNHREQTNGGDDLCFVSSGQRRFAELFFNKIDKMDSQIGLEMSLIVVEAIRGRCASFMILTTTVSEIFGGQTNSSILVVLDVLAGVPVGGKLSVCLIWNCMKYRIIILIIIIKRLGEILLSYMANTSHTHARTHPVVDDVVSSRRPITPEIHLLSLTIFTQEALVTLICMNLSVSYPNWYELK